MQRYFLHLAYAGTHYNGWQIQANASSVQDTINRSLQTIFRKPLNVVGCGRTDAGVHARQFFAHFDLEEKLSVEEKRQTIYKMNAILPKDIVIYDLLPVAPEAHARFDAISRTYTYQINTFKNPFEDEFTYHYIQGELNLELMNDATKRLLQHTDFTSFSKLHTQVKTNNCKIYSAVWEKKNSRLIFTISADRFLRNMVRAIVGTLIDVGRGKISLPEFNRIIESKNRSNAGYSVPAKGLFLEEIKYPDSIFYPAS